MKCLMRIYSPLVALVLALPAYSQTPAANNTKEPANSSPVEMTDAITPMENEQADLAINLAHSLAREKRYREALQAYQEFARVFGHTPRLREARENMARI